LNLSKNLEYYYISKPHKEFWGKYSKNYSNDPPIIIQNHQILLSVVTQEVRQFVASWVINAKQNVDFVEEKAKKSMYCLLCEDIFKCLCVFTTKNFFELSDLKFDYKTLMMLDDINHETDIETDIDVESNLKSSHPLFLINYLLEDKLIAEQKQYILNNIKDIKSHFWYFFQKDYSNILTLLILNYKGNEDIKALWENHDAVEYGILSPSYWALSFDQYGEDRPKIKNFILNIINKEAHGLNNEKIKNLNNEINLFKDHNLRLLKDKKSYIESEEFFTYYNIKKLEFIGTLQDLAISTEEIQKILKIESFSEAAKLICCTHKLLNEKGENKVISVEKLIEAKKRYKRR